MGFVLPICVTHLCYLYLLQISYEIVLFVTVDVDDRSVRTRLEKRTEHKPMHAMSSAMKSHLQISPRLVQTL